jgi:spore coat polysaccharide biosynthesis protein SpsF
MVFDDHHSDISYGKAHRPDLYNGPKPMNKQANHWAGTQGNDYAARSPGNINSMAYLWHTILCRNVSRGFNLASVIEFGAGMGTNLQALKRIYTHPTPLHRTGVEINKDTCMHLAQHCETLICSPLQELKPLPPADLTYTRGVLIHIPEPDLPHVYDLLYHSSRRWIMVAEYYAPKRTMIPYRGQDNLLWKADFAGEMMDRHKGLILRDYGFVYHGDRDAPQDDVTWFLMEKTFTVGDTLLTSNPGNAILRSE